MSTPEEMIAHLQGQVTLLTGAVQSLQATAAVAPPHASTKPSKPPTFSSVKDSGPPTSWLFSVDLYFQVSRTPDDQKVDFAVTFLRGSAALWWQAQCREVSEGTRQPVAGWVDFKDEFRATFSPVDASKIARDQLRGLQQAKSVAEYTDRFRTLVLQIPDMSSAEGLDRFVAGLKPHIRERVEIEDPKQLSKAMHIAQRMDTIHSRSLQRSSNASFSQTSASAATPQAVTDSATPMELGAMRPQPPNQRRFPAKLKPGDRQRFRDQDRCFRCRQVGHWHADCPGLNRPPSGAQSNQRRW